MGFRDLEGFNLALLARQGWRLLQFPDSLLARLLKARYYLSTTFLQAEVGYAPSYVWRSIMRGKEVLDNGCFWMVGNGANIYLRSDPWVPNARGFRPGPMRTPMTDQLTRAIELIDWGVGKWKEEVVWEHYNEIDVRAICSIHLIDSCCQDSIVWSRESSGVFTVKTGYHVAMEIKMGRSSSASSSDSERMKKLWSIVWGVQVTPRVRDFMLRCCKEVLPCKFNLLRRHCMDEAGCLKCGRVETQLHVLLECPQARKVWKMTPSVKGIGRAFSSYKDWMETAYNRLGKEVFAEWAVIGYGIWQARNSLTFQGVAKEPEVILEDQMVDLTEVRTWRKELKQPSTSRHCGKWRKPLAGYIKINCDASVSSDGCDIDVIARDSNGPVRFVGGRRIQDDTDPAVAEAEAMLWALAFARDLQLEFTIIESDCLLVVSKLRRRNCGNGVLGSLLGMCIKAASRGGLVVFARDVLDSKTSLILDRREYVYVFTILKPRPRKIGGPVRVPILHLPKAGLWVLPCDAAAALL